MPEASISIEATGSWPFRYAYTVWNGRGGCLASQSPAFTEAGARARAERLARTRRVVENYRYSGDGPSLEGTDPELIAILRSAADRWGARRVADAARKLAEH